MRIYEEVACPHQGCPWRRAVAWSRPLRSPLRMPEKLMADMIQRHLETHLDPWLTGWKHREDA